MWIFFAVDFATLVIQAVGGALAALGFTDVRLFASHPARVADSLCIPQSQIAAGSNIMLAGIVLQLVTMLLFLGLFLSYFRLVRRYATEARQAVAHGLVQVYWAMLLAVFLVVARLVTPSQIFVGSTADLAFRRGFYRTAELAQGFTGKVAHTRQ